MPKSAMYGVFWHECVICGVTYPEGEVNKNTAGEWVCSRDLDE
jgi:hypothetical protein